MRDAEDHEITIPAGSIEEQKPGPSLMPAGLIEPLTRAELVDLVRFLSELGKIGPYSVSKERVLRRWRVLESTGKAATALIRTSVDAVIQNQDSWAWRPFYTTVGGVLPSGELPVNPRVNNAPPIALAQSVVQLTTPGKVKLRVRLDEGPGVLDRRPTRRAGLGRARRADPRSRSRRPTRCRSPSSRAFDPTGLRCVLEDVDGSSAQALPVLGK